MDLFNARGCDEIMCQFIKDLDSSYDFYNRVEVEEITEIKNNSIVNIETIE